MCYTKILLAVDFSEHGEKVIERAIAMASALDAEISITHVVQLLPVMDSSFGPIVPYDVNMSDEMVAMARQNLSKLAMRLDIPETRCKLEVGSPKAEIIKYASEIKADLIILGSHSRHGIGLLLGSTASSVIHHAECDVLTVRLPS